MKIILTVGFRHLTLIAFTTECYVAARSVKEGQYYDLTTT